MKINKAKVLLASTLALAMHTQIVHAETTTADKGQSLTVSSSINSGQTQT